MRVTVVDALVFTAELAVYGSAAWAAWTFLPRIVPATIGALAGVVVMATWWGVLHSPKAPVHLPRALDIALRAAWFGVGLIAAVCAARGSAAS